MKRFLRRTIQCVVPATLAALVFGIPTAASDLSLQNANLACNDGTNLNLALDATALTTLTNAVNAINLYPAGDPALVCGLNTDPPSSGSGNPHWDYAVGGGRAIIVTRCAPQEDNFGFDAKVDPASNGTTGSGHFNLTIPACTSTNTGTTYNASHLNMTVDCLKVDGTTGDAELTAAVNKATGLFASSAEFPSGLKEISFKLHDSGVPGGTGDLIGWDFGTASSPCDFHAQDYATVDNGNINVHQAP